MSLALRSNTKAVVKRESVPGSNEFDLTIGTVWGNLSPISGTENMDGMNVVVALHKFRCSTDSVSFTEKDQLEINGKQHAITLVNTMGLGRGQQIVAQLKEIR